MEKSFKIFTFKVNRNTYIFGYQKDIHPFFIYKIAIT